MLEAEAATRGAYGGKTGVRGAPTLLTATAHDVHHLGTLMLAAEAATRGAFLGKRGLPGAPALLTATAWQSNLHKYFTSQSADK